MHNLPISKFTNYQKNFLLLFTLYKRYRNNIGRAKDKRKISEV
ncbi:hypothetical protein HMPREF9074_07234 [Capnocytophaga sp. oral taxon 329 str. F0087]|nr:hypothetical protein HMPREF9074_07234 [Capnocytophaga sp. oral taxon 329 str. F0087]